MLHIRSIHRIFVPGELCVCASFEDLPSMHDDDLLSSDNCAEPEARNMSDQCPNLFEAECDCIVVSFLRIPLVSPSHDCLLS